MFQGKYPTKKSFVTELPPSNAGWEAYYSGVLELGEERLYVEETKNRK